MCIRDRKKVTCIHKANILKMSDGMFLSIFKEITKEYPEIEGDDKIIDNTCMQDVYKRQDCSSCSVREILSQSRRLPHLQVVSNSKFVSVEALSPVSYTHLDVYKRQC